MSNGWQGMVKRLFADQREISADRIICRKSGVVELRREFFYRMGRSSDKQVARVKEYLAEHGVEFGGIDGYEEFREWPKLSEIVVRIYPPKK